MARVDPYRNFRFLVEIDGIRVAKLEAIVELKLASGMTNPNRMKDLADVQEIIKVLRLPRDFGDNLHEFVRDRFIELWTGLQNDPDPHEQNPPPHE